MEEYQYMEMHLKGICEAISSVDAEGWLKRLDVNKHNPLHELIDGLEKKMKETGNHCLSKQEIAKLREVLKRRNYWCHECFKADNHVIFKGCKESNEKVIRDSQYADDIAFDLKTAEEWNIRLGEVFRNNSNHIKYSLI